MAWKGDYDDRHNRSEEQPMPMIDVYAATGTFSNKPELTKALNAALMRWEKVPLIPWFQDNTAAFIHELPADSVANASGSSKYVRIQVLTPVGVLDRDKKLGVTMEMTGIVAGAAGDPGLAERTWVQIVEAPDGGWGIAGHAYTNAEIATTAREKLAAK
jgi:phenylpyruvate tautomerase PptA (4-oxalocrotonate tautomerase family)